MNSASVFVDRAWIHELAMPGTPNAQKLGVLLSNYDLVAIESAGASVLDQRLQNNRLLGSRLYIVSSKDYAGLNSARSDDLMASIRELECNELVESAYRGYVARSGRMAVSLEELLRYVYRMLCLGDLLDADLLVGKSRLAVLEVVLKQHGARLDTVDTNNCVERLTVSEWVGILPNRREPREFNVLTIDGVDAPRAVSVESPLGKGQEGQRTAGHAFLSYCQENRETVRELRQALIDKGVTIWWDQDILPGQDWNLEIRKALWNSRAVVICFSREADARLQSGIYPEILDAISLHRKRNPRIPFLFPIRLSECEIPSIEIDSMRMLDRIQYIDLFPTEQWSTNLDRLAKALLAVES
jgi:hypothetical protein